MPLNKATGQMYDWCSHVHTHLRGQCPHACTYCSTATMARRFPVMKKCYTGPVRLEAKELKVDYGSGKTIFIEHCMDLFADQVPAHFIKCILDHCWSYPKNQYVFQTKNPNRIVNDHWMGSFPVGSMIGCTIETNRQYQEMGNTPDTYDRIDGMMMLKLSGFKTFITIEPILDFDPMPFSDMLARARPCFVNIGADSKGHGLHEPTKRDILFLIECIKASGIEIRQKHNLGRLLK